MIRNKQLRFMFALAVCLIGAVTYSFIPLQQQGSQIDYFSSALTTLVGKKVKVVSFEGKRMQGTLWNFNDEFISVKVKKGLVYSRTETIEISEIDYIEDPDGRKISMLELEALSQIETAKTTGGGSGNKSTLYFHTDDILGSNSRESAKTDRAFNNKAPEKKNEFSSGLARRSSTPKTSYKRPPATRPARSKVTKRRPIRTRAASAPRSEKSKSSSTRVAKRAEKKSSDTLVASSDKNPAVEPSENGAAKTAPAIAAASRLRALQQSAAFIRTETVAGQSKKLRYQNFILFGVIGIAFCVLIIAKVREANGAFAGDASLFPAAIVKMNGQFGLINQGIIDGIKLGDVIKLYRKEGRHVDFKGKAHVRKIANKFSLVEMIKTKKLQYLEIGDTGFVDRSFSSNIVRGFRRASGTILQGLASGLGQAAKNVEGTVETPDGPKALESDRRPKPVTVQPKVVTPRPQPVVQPKVVTPRPQPSVPSRPAHTPVPQPRVTVVDQPAQRPQPNVATAGQYTPQLQPRVTVVDSPVPQMQPDLATVDHAAQSPVSNVTVVDRAAPQPRVTVVDRPQPQLQPDLTIVAQPPRPKTAPVGFGLEHL